MTLDDRIAKSVETGAPRRSLACDVTNCPWCQHEIDAGPEDALKPLVCMGCGRESVVLPGHYDVVIQGLRSPADLKYLAARSA